MGVRAARVFKTLTVNAGDRDLIVAVLPVSSMLDMKLPAKAAGRKGAQKAALAG